MPSRRSRVRHRGRHESGRHYAMLHDDMLQSEAYRALPHFARTVLTGIAAQYRGMNNGDLDFPSRKAVLYGIDHKELSAARFLLEKVGLIEVTRQGRVEGGKGICTLFALTSWPVDPSQKYDVPTVLARPASNAWVKWKPSDDWAQVVRKVSRRAQGRKTDPLSAREERKRSFFTPHDGDAFLESGRGVRQVEHMVTDYPHMSDVDIAVAFKWKINQIQVARIRQNLADGSEHARTSDIVPVRQLSEAG